jgi:hypothetical protein
VEASRDGAGELRSGALSTWNIVFLVVATAAPLTAMVTAMPVAVALGNGAGAVGTYVAGDLHNKGHDVTLIEQDKAHVDLLRDELDVNWVLGDACELYTLDAAVLYPGHQTTETTVHTPSGAFAIM